MNSVRGERGVAYPWPLPLDPPVTARHRQLTL